MRLRRTTALVVLIAALASCGAAETAVPESIVVDPAYELTVAMTGFDRPTQLAAIPGGGFVIGELAGAENDATGEIVLVDGGDTAERTLLQTGMDKPTGLAVVGDQLWIMQRDSLSVTSLDPDAALELVAGDLPNNGRSQGSLTVTPTGALLFDTSGRKRGAVRTEGSGSLFRIDEPANWSSQPPTTVATGFKHAYAHTVTPDGRLWAVEMTDGNFDGVRANDELIQVEFGDDAGWPFCVDDNRPVAEYGGTAELCATSPRSHALFAPGATPTAVVVAPWDPNMLLVSLWISSTVVAVPVDQADTPHAGQVIVEGIESPQSLLVDGDRVLIVDHETGIVFALSSTA